VVLAGRLGDGALPCAVQMSPIEAQKGPFEALNTVCAHVWCSQADSVTVLFPVRFKDANDATIAATFLSEFAEARRGSATLSTAPACSYSKAPPRELMQAGPIAQVPNLTPLCLKSPPSAPTPSPPPGELMQAGFPALVRLPNYQPVNIRFGVTSPENQPINYYHN
jgi:hypothetical protein